MHTISYTKHFISGALKGLSVPCTLHVDKRVCAVVQAHLNGFTEEFPGADALTGSQWWASGVSCGC